MYALDVVTTELTLDPDDLRKLAKLPKTATMEPDVEVSKGKDGEVYSITINFKQYKDHKVQGEK